MNIVKLGGSVVNPTGKYDPILIDTFISIVKKSRDSFLFIIGGGKICRFIQDAARSYLREALQDEKEVSLANDELGLAVTKINARYVLHCFQEKLGRCVYPEILLDPTQYLQEKAKVFFAGGWKPGHSTDTDMMLLAETFKAPKIFKLSNFDIVRRIRPENLVGLSEQEKTKQLQRAEEISSLTWRELHDLVGKDWKPGLNTPFDPSAVKLGLEMKKALTLYIGKEQEFPKMLQGKAFRGTVVKG
ncbi:hypothetical protein J4421_06545 [Candidatus Woesearchaeota archaeon]|nr:hypothetical protein [Candidatus Woesearchaeota archaeon]